MAPVGPVNETGSDRADRFLLTDMKHRLEVRLIAMTLPAPPRWSAVAAGGNRGLAADRRAMRFGVTRSISASPGIAGGAGRGDCNSEDGDRPGYGIIVSAGGRSMQAGRQFSLGRCRSRERSSNPFARPVREGAGLAEDNGCGPCGAIGDRLRFAWFHRPHLDGRLRRSIPSTGLTC